MRDYYIIYGLILAFFAVASRSGSSPTFAKGPHDESVVLQTRLSRNNEFAQLLRCVIPAQAVQARIYPATRSTSAVRIGHVVLLVKLV